MDISLPNLRHLRIFLAVCYLNSTVRTAQHMQLSQPAVTQAIAKLETYLNKTLFERHSDGMTPSSAGAIFKVRIERALTWLDASIATLLPSHITPTSELQKLTTTQLTALIAVHDFKNFSAASRALNVAQSSVYRAAKEFEKLLQIELFDPVMTRSFTPQGQVFIRTTKLVFDEIRQGMLDIDAEPSQDIANLRIGCPKSSQDALLSDTIIRFEHHHPAPRLQLEDDEPTQLCQQLANGDLDFIIDETQRPFAAHTFSVETIALPTLLFACRAQHPLLARPAIKLSDLSDYEWVIPHSLPTSDYPAKDLLSDSAIQPIKLLKTSSSYLARALILHSHRITWMYSNQFASDPNIQALIKVPSTLCESPKTARIVMRKTWLPTQTQSNFLDTLRAVAAFETQL